MQSIVVRQFTPLHAACLLGDKELLCCLLEARTENVNAQTERKETPLHLAMRHNKSSCVTTLIEHGAFPSKKDITELTPLMVGIENESYNAITALINACRDLSVPLNVNKASFSGFTALHCAVIRNSFLAVKLIVEAGADVNAKDRTGCSPLFFAMEAYNNRIAAYLKEKGAVFEPIRSPASPALSLPHFIACGYLMDDVIRQSEIKYGGTPWADLVEGFYTGKKPKTGLCVEILVKLWSNSYTRLRGIIHLVSNETVVASVSLITTHAGKFGCLAGRWEATLQVDDMSPFPWILTKLTPLVDPSLSYANLLQKAKQRTRKFQVNAESAGSNQRMILKGVPFDRADDIQQARIIKEVDLKEDTTMLYTFEDGSAIVIYEPEVEFPRLIARVLEFPAVKQSVQLKFHGVPINWNDFMNPLLSSSEHLQKKPKH